MLNFIVQIINTVRAVVWCFVFYSSSTGRYCYLSGNEEYGLMGYFQSADLKRSDTFGPQL